MSAQAMEQAQQGPSSWKKIAGVTSLLIVVIVVFLVAFALPSINSEVKHIAVGLVAPEPLASAVIDGLDVASPDTFDVTIVESASAARALIEEREAFGAFVVTANGLTVETASAASYAVATALGAAGQQIGAAVDVPVTVDDVVPFSEADPRGVGLSAGALPIALGGWIAAVGILSAIHGTRQRLITAGVFAVVGGFALTAVLQFWLGTFTGNYWLTSLGAVLGIAATSFLVLGMQRMFKAAGIVMAAIILVLLGNPLSGLSSAPEILPEPWGAIGQLLPPGATGTLLRNTAFFDGAATTMPIIVLAIWFVFGLGLYLLAVARDRRRDPAAIE
ncbi:hypothetical protein EV379_3443 [Microterricola gilva]|uniref:ABC transporter permease n=1 Tax=Microterricola gilva TaxID=393267 RepID=A0A4Q8AQW7_9MICO|nr:hypothetical protein [Microterricola gilva]RZU67067.1 hypothetical protein EV379_3443 [Microterricola gilva]